MRKKTALSLTPPFSLSLSHQLYLCAPFGEGILPHQGTELPAEATTRHAKQQPPGLWRRRRRGQLTNLLLGGPPTTEPKTPTPSTMGREGAVHTFKPVVGVWFGMCAWGVWTANSCAAVGCKQVWRGCVWNGPRFPAGNQRNNSKLKGGWIDLKIERIQFCTLAPKNASIPSGGKPHGVLGCVFWSQGWAALDENGAVCSAAI